MKKTLSEFAWQVYPEQCRLLLGLYKESPKRFTAFLFSFLKWLEDGAKQDGIEAHTPEILKPFEREAFKNECNSHLQRFRNHHDGKSTSTTQPKSTRGRDNPNPRPSRDEINALCMKYNRDPAEYGRRVWDEFTKFNWLDRTGNPITNYTAYIEKVLIPMIDKTLYEQTKDNQRCSSASLLEDYPLPR